MRARAMESAIGVSDLLFERSGAFRLEVPELRIAPGEKVALVGPSGSGKTTLIHLLAGLLQPQRGRIEVAGTTVSSLSDGERRAFRIRRLGLVFQELELLDYLTALQNVLLPARLSPEIRRTPGLEQRGRALCGRAGLQNLMGRSPRRLSQGERQRVAVCRALVTAPPVLLCDEPTGNLDPITTGRVLDLLFEEALGAGSTVVMVTHDHSLLTRFDRVLDMARWIAGGTEVSG